MQFTFTNGLVLRNGQRTLELTRVLSATELQFEDALTRHPKTLKTAEVLKTQITGAFVGITAEAAAPIVIAYEPVWAIGTGKTATPEIAVDAHKIIRAEVAKLLGADVAAAVRILYGGSVKPDNATSLIGQEEIDGALVGGASLKPDSFAAIVKY